MNWNNTQHACWVVGLAGLWSVLGTASAAPLDALRDLPNTPVDGTAHWRVEADADLSQTLVHALGKTRETGHTHSLRLDWHRDRWVVDGALDQRAIPDKNNLHHVHSWQAAVQYELTPAADADTPLDLSTQRWAVRMGAWGNRADHLLQTVNSTFKAGGLKGRLLELEVVEPRDTQWQLDLVGRLSLRSQPWHLSGLVGLGHSAVTRRSVQGKAAFSNCSYTLNFGAERLNALPTGDCAEPLLISVPNTLLNYDANQETDYRSLYGHVAVAAHWQAPDWRGSVGVELQHWRRSVIDASRPAVTLHAVLATEWEYRLSPQWSAVARGQYLHHQYLGEVPMLYNTRTASRFTTHAANATLGVVARF